MGRLAVDLAAVGFEEEDLGAAGFLAAAALTGALFLASTFVEVAFFAVAVLAVAFEAAGVLEGLALVAVLLAADLRAVPDDAAALLVAAPLADELDLATFSLGSFFAPEATALSCAPARNFGTEVFLARTL